MIEVNVVTQKPHLEKLREWLDRQKVLAIDTETTGLSPIDDRVRLIQIANETEVWVIDAFCFQKQDIYNVLRHFTENSNNITVMHNAAFDVGMMRYQYGLEFEVLYDTMLMAKLIYAGDFRLPAKLSAVVHNFLGVQIDKGEQLSDWSRELTKEQIEYSALDAWILLPLAKVLNKNLIRFGLLETALIECEAINAVVDLKLNGLLLDVNKWTELVKIKEKEFKELEHNLMQFAGVDRINFNSPKQVMAMFENNGVYVQSTGVDKLKEYAHIPLVAEFMKYRKVKKQLDSFGLSILKFVNRTTGRIHSTFWQMGAKSGRLSASDINTMQLPKTKEVRSCFVAREGYKMLTLDYSQFELRITAEASGEPMFINAYNNNIDLHTQTTSASFAVPMESVTDDQRQIGKRINFGTVYGIGANSFSEKFDIEFELATQLIDRFHKANPVLAGWLRKQASKCYGIGYTTSASGRIINLKKAVGMHENPQNLAKNFPIQSTNADVLKIAMAKVRPILKQYNAFLVNVVHDEMLIECPTEHSETLLPIVKEVMLEAGRRYIKCVPLDVSGMIADSWTK